MILQADPQFVRFWPLLFFYKCSTRATIWTDFFMFRTVVWTSTRRFVITKWVAKTSPIVNTYGHTGSEDVYKTIPIAFDPAIQTHHVVLYYHGIRIDNVSAYLIGRVIISFTFRCSFRHGRKLVIGLQIRSKSYVLLMRERVAFKIILSEHRTINI